MVEEEEGMEKRKEEDEEATMTMTEYEKQRLSRIRENKARLEALGLLRLASSPLLRPPPPKKTTKATSSKKHPRRHDGGGGDDDEEYQPPDDGGEEDEESSSPSGEDDDDDEQEEKKSKASSSRSQRKGKKTGFSNAAKPSKSSFVKRKAYEVDFVDDDIALEQAIALSLEASIEDSVAAPGGDPSSTGTKETESAPPRKNDTGAVQGSAKNRKTKKLNKSKVQLTEDEVVAFFFSFDEVGKGYITVWDLERMAAMHDFSWTESEIAKMIRCFDSDGDGKINLEDFRTIVSRCSMLQHPGQ